MCEISKSSSRSWDITITDVPFLESSKIDCLITFSAPASIPQVGWEIINKFGFDKISRPITNFCKLPPDKLEALASESEVITLYSLIILFE